MVPIVVASILAIILAAILFRVLAGAGSRHLPSAEWRRVWHEDAMELLRMEDQLAASVLELKGLVEGSSRDVKVVPPPDQRALAGGAWCRIADLSESIRRRAAFHRDFALNARRGSADHLRGFLFCDAADLLVQDAALSVTDAVAENPKWATVFNEARPAFGLPENSYDSLRDEVHNPERFARQFAAQAYLAVTRRLKEFGELQGDENAAALVAICDRLHGSVSTRYRQRVGEYSARQTRDFSASIASRAWFPVQKNVANAMGNVKMKRQGEYLMAPHQIRELRALLQPGDIGVSRKYWYLSNCGIPGFWTHALLHVGTAEELDRFFDDDDVKAWCASMDAEARSVTELLRRRHPKAWESHAASVPAADARARGAHVGDLADDDLLQPAFIEAIAPGVVFRLPEETTAADCVAFLRPRLPKVELAKAIERAFSHAGKPYDYNFDFTTDNELVCSELIYKAYEPDSVGRGLALPLDETLGRPILAPTTLVRLFDEQFDSPDRFFDFVVFYDARESMRASFPSTIEDFRTSWHRPKWHVLVN